jgi:hypothetical protein
MTSGLSCNQSFFVFQLTILGELGSNMMSWTLIWKFILKTQPQL